jgi:hypothetical protein
MKKLIFLLMLYSVTAFAQNVPSYVPTNGLVGWWPFNGNANDESGNNYNLLNNGATYSLDRYGNLNSAFTFNSASYLQSGHIQNLNSEFNSISFWIKASSFSVHHQIEYATQTFGNLGRAFAVNTARLANVPHYNCVNALAPANLALSGQVLNSVWTHLVYSSNGNTCSFYVNGQLAGQAAIPNSICQSPLTLVIGRGTNGSGPMWFSGDIDDVCIWSRALSSQEVNLLFTGCADTLSTQPQNFTAFTNPGWAYFTCKSSDTAATYQWQQNSGAGWVNLQNFGNFTGATTDSLVITGITTAMNNFGYRCIATACSTDTSDVAVLTITNGMRLGEIILDQLTLSPVPTDGFVRLNSEAIGTYEILTVDGRLIESGEAKMEYDLSQHPCGIYNLRIRTVEGIRVLKVVKN